MRMRMVQKNKHDRSIRRWKPSTLRVTVQVQRLEQVEQDKKALEAIVGQCKGK